MEQITHRELIRAAEALGAYRAAVVPGSEIVSSPEFRQACRANSCGQYGRCWMCPPDIGEIEALMEQLKQYSYGLLYQTVFQLEDSFDVEGMMDSGNRHCQLSRKIGRQLGPMLPGRSLHLIAGGCRYCGQCAKAAGEPCRFPEQALSSLEAYGVDVYHTAKNAGLSYINGPDTVTFFSMILFTEAEDV